MRLLEGRFVNYLTITLGTIRLEENPSST